MNTTTAPSRARFCNRLTAVLAAALSVATLIADAAFADPSTALARRADIASTAAAVGNHYRSAVPCTSSSCGVDNKWDDAYLMMGMIEHWRKHGTGAYKTYSENWAKANKWRLFSNTSGTDQRNPNWSNRMIAGHGYLRLLQAGSPGASTADVAANLDAQLKLKISPEREQLVDYVFPGQTKNSFSFKAADAEFALPIWVMMGKHTGKSAYYTRARDLHNYQVNVMGLRDPATKLWYRDETFKTARSPNGEKVMWGRGNGWVASALAQMLTELPSSRAEYPTYRTRFVELMAAARSRQRPDGFWNMNLTDPKHFPAPETSATALLTYAMARGIDLGILDNSYRATAAKAWNAMAATAVADDGHLGFCQPIGLAPVPPGDPNYPSEASTAETNFCVGAFLLAGTAVHQIATSTGPSRARTYQAESMTTQVSTGDSQADVTNTYADDRRANSATLNAKNDYVQFTATNVPSGTYDLRVKFRRATNHGIWQLKTDGVNTGAPVDGYDPSAHYAEVDLGFVTYSGGSGTKQYRFVSTGKHGLSNGFRIGIDSLSLYQIAAGSLGQALYLTHVNGAGSMAFALGPVVPSPSSVPLPPAAGLLIAGVGLLGLARFGLSRRL